MSDEIEVVNGPIPPQQPGSMIFSVTLLNGYPITNPFAFEKTTKDEQTTSQIRPLK